MPHFSERNKVRKALQTRTTRPYSSRSCGTMRKNIRRKGTLAYTVSNGGSGETIRYSGRDLNFETKRDDCILSGKP